MTCAGCVLSDPPEHGRANQTPPILFPNQASPPVFGVLSVSPGEQVPFNVPIRSEDAGENLQAELILDYSIVDPDDLQEAVPVTAGTLEDTQRSITLVWNVPNNLEPGCRQLTLLVFHISNLDVKQLEDLATVTWMVNLGDSDSAPNELRNCPKVLGTTP